MSGRGSEAMPWDSLSVGATRQAVIRGLNVPFWFVMPIVGLPMVLASATQNPFWLLMIIVLTVLGRWIVSTDHNRPRVLRLSFLSGAMFADRHRWGGDSIDPLGRPRDAG